MISIDLMRRRCIKLLLMIIVSLSSSSLIACATNAKKDTLRIVNIAPEKSPCAALAVDITCMMVKWENKQQYELFYSDIEGFEFEPGYEYQLRVMVEKIENPPADASNLRYKLIEQIRKKKMHITMKDDTQTKNLANKTWQLVRFKEKDITGSPDTHFMMMNAGQNKLSSKVGCNNLTFAYKISEQSSIQMSLIGSTRMLCPQDTIESEYIAMMATVNHFELTQNGQHLNFYAGQNIVSQYHLVK